MSRENGGRTRRRGRRSRSRSREKKDSSRRRFRSRSRERGDYDSKRFRSRERSERKDEDRRRTRRFRSNEREEKELKDGDRVKGHVSRWNDERGFGFLKVSGARKDVFVHVSAITDGNALKEGSEVEFDVRYEQDKGKFRAENLKGGFQDENRRGGGDSGGDGRRGGPPVCFAFQSGRCDRGNECRFAHVKRNDTADDERRLKRMKQRAEAMRNVKSIWAPSVSPPNSPRSSSEKKKKDTPQRDTPNKDIPKKGNDINSTSSENEDQNQPDKEKEVYEENKDEIEVDFDEDEDEDGKASSEEKETIKISKEEEADNDGKEQDESQSSSSSSSPRRKRKRKKSKKKKKKKKKKRKKRRHRSPSSSSESSGDDNVEDSTALDLKKHFQENKKEVDEEDDDTFGPQPIEEEVVPGSVAGSNVHYGGQLMPGEGNAIAAYVQKNMRIPRRGEVGWQGEEIAQLEDLGYVMSGSRHTRMEAIRLRKENQVYTAEEKRALLLYNYEQNQQRENKLIADFREMISDKFKAKEAEHE